MGDIHALALTFFGKREDIGWMLGALGTLRASWTNARFANFGQRTFEGGPKSVPVFRHRPREGRFHKRRLTDHFFSDKYVYISIYIHALKTPTPPNPIC